MRRLTTVLMAAAAIAFAAPSFGADATAAKPASKEQKANRQPPGYQAAETLSMITGVAISPLLGVGAVGCYQYLKTPKEQKHKLHWFAQPWFFIPALLIVTLVMFKDVAGPGTPTVLKKPIDVAEAIENKISGLIAAGAFIPLVTEFFPQASGLDNGACLSSLGFAGLDMAAVLNVMMVPLAVTIFAVVWLASHAINILILISPFTTVDTALKAFRASLLSLVAITQWINPYLGAAFSIVIIVIAYFIAGWSFRLLILGQVFIWDYVSFRRTRFAPAGNGNKLFTACKIDQTPIRTYGRLCRDEQGAFRFEYRPWMFLTKKTLTLPAGEYVVGRGMLYPEIQRDEGKDQPPRTLFILPPRYNTHEEKLAAAYQLGAVRDVGLRKGLKALWKGIKDLFGSKTSAEAATGAA